MTRKLVLVLFSVLLISSLVLVSVGCQSAPATSAAPTTTQAQATTSTDQKFVWDMQTNHPMVSTLTKFFGEEWATYVGRLTEGQVTVKFNPPDTFASGKECLPSLGKGVYDVLVSHSTQQQGVVDVASIEEGLPLSWHDPMEAWDAYYNRGLLDLIREGYAKHNVYVLAGAPLWLTLGIHTKFEYTGLDRLNGKVFHAVGTMGEILAALGVKPTDIPLPDLYMALSTGVADGMVFGLSPLKGYKLAEVIKYTVVNPSLSIGGSGFNYINLDTWNALPKNLQDLIEENSKGFFQIAAYKYREDMLQAQFWAAKEHGVQFVSMTPADQEKITNVAMGMWDKVATKSPLCAKGVDIIKQQMRDYGRIK